MTVATLMEIKGVISVEDNKKLTNEEILRQQLELLAERSEKAHSVDLASITNAMVKIFEVLESNSVNR